MKSSIHRSLSIAAAAAAAAASLGFGLVALSAAPAFAAPGPSCPTPVAPLPTNDASGAASGCEALFGQPGSSSSALTYTPTVVMVNRVKEITFTAYFADETTQSDFMAAVNGTTLPAGDLSVNPDSALESQFQSAYSACTGPLGASPSPCYSSIYQYYNPGNGGSPPGVGESPSHPSPFYMYRDTVTFPASMLRSTTSTIVLTTDDSDSNWDQLVLSFPSGPTSGLPIDAAAGGIGVAVLAGAGLVFISRRRRVRA